MLIKTVSFLICVLFTSIVYANQAPESVVEQYFTTMKKDGYGVVAKFIHPDEQKKFKNLTHSSFEKMLSTIDDSNANSLLADPKDSSKIRTLSDAEYMNAVMKWYELTDPELLHYLREAKVKILGSIKEENVFHVVVRLTVNHNDLMTVISVKDYMGTAKMLLTGEMQGIIKASGRQP
ncbi:MAG: hypothetical protein GY705_00500 [Bacteroidetes bacterium]|nr:hypothetical protein [Bacteroidota bacterium]